MTSRKGNHVTYSEVVVEDVGNGFTMYQYNNKTDTQLLNQFTEHSEMSSKFLVDKILLNEIERGLPLLQRVYDNNKKLLKEEIYEYNKERGDYDVRFIRRLANPINMMIYESFRVIAGTVQCYYPYLKSITVKNYENGGEVTTISKKTEDPFYRVLLSEETQNADDRWVKKEYTYPFHDSENPVLRRMMDLNMVNYPVSTIYKMNNIEKKITRNNYASGLSINPNLILLSNVTTQLSGQQEYVEQQILKYDRYGNPLSVVNRGDHKTTYLWSYNGMYPFLRAEGLTWEQLSAKVPVNTIDNYAKKSFLTENEILGVKDLLDGYNDQTGKMNTLISTYQYEPLIGLKKTVAPNGIMKQYQYDNMGRLQSVRDHNNLVEEYYLYEYKSKISN